MWCGFYVVACSSGLGLADDPLPVAMIYLLTSLSGKPMLERKLSKTRAGYDEYVATTSSFIPLATEAHDPSVREAAQAIDDRRQDVRFAVAFARDDRSSATSRG